VYARAKEEGERRLDMPPVMQASTGFIAGVTIVFGIVARHRELLRSGRALSPEAQEALVTVGEEVAGKSPLATFARAIAAGTLLTLLSYLLVSSRS
jgi:formate/nitrite transporter FocA (FNT family)